MQNSGELLQVSGRLGRRRGAFPQMLDRGSPLVAQMLEQDVTELVAGATTQRLQDGFMFTHRFAPAVALAGKIGGVANPANPSREVGIGALQRRVARSLDDLLVDQLVDAEIAVHVAMQVKTVHLIVQSLDLGDSGVADVFAGEASGETFESAHDVEQLVQV